jgi:hypothetical protein
MHLGGISIDKKLKSQTEENYTEKRHRSMQTKEPPFFPYGLLSR